MILETIKGSADLKRLGLPQLGRLADEIRERIIAVISKNGGHLAPSLGTVELTLALHYVLDTPQDKLVWDVGHQTYAHKLVTGRQDRFDTIRTLGGLSGFPKRSESPYDCFDTGHASTSISAVLGMACARDLAGEKYRTVAVIGDGSLTGGLAFEGLNHAGQLKRNMLVVLNDNRMAISKRVGALGQYLTRITTTPAYTKFEVNLWNFLGKLPPDIGQPTRVMFRRIREGFKNLIVPGLTFEELGYHYEGPIDGHDLAALIDILQRVKDLPGPTLLHVLTVKGKGFKPAEADAEKFHGVGAFDPETGDPLQCGGSCTYTQAFGRSLVALARRDPAIVAITAAMPEGTGLDLFRSTFPKRFFDVGIAEQHALTFAAGLAAQGCKPVVAIYSTFLQRGYDQIIHDIAMQRLPVVIAVDRAGIVGEDGPTHHGPFDLSYLNCVPNLTVMAPRDESQLASMLLTAVNLGGPAVLRYPRGGGFGVPLAEPVPLELGRGETLKAGAGGLIIGIGIMATVALEVSRKLLERGLDIEVIDARFFKPLDENLLVAALKRHRRALTVEEGALDGGFGESVLSLASRAGIASAIKTIGLPRVFIEAGPRSVLLDRYGLSGERLLEEAAAFFAAHP